MWHSAKQRSGIVLSVVMMSVIMLSVVMLKVVMLSLQRRLKYPKKLKSMMFSVE